MSKEAQDTDKTITPPTLSEIVKHPENYNVEGVPLMDVVQRAATLAQISLLLNLCTSFKKEAEDNAWHSVASKVMLSMAEGMLDGAAKLSASIGIDLHDAAMRKAMATAAVGDPEVKH